jgi:hypothetical protein
MAQARKAGSSPSLAERDFERARALYEPISGFSNVSEQLRKLETDQEGERAYQQQRQQQLAASAHKGKTHRRTSRRLWRWR